MKRLTLCPYGPLAIIAALPWGCTSGADHLRSSADRTPRAQERADFTGVWSAHESGRSIAIRATAAELIVEPPTLPTEIYRLDGSDYTSVRDVGTWWIKNRTRLHWVDSRTLRLTLTSFTGWWHVHRPSEVARSCRSSKPRAPSRCAATAC